MGLGGGTRDKLPQSWQSSPPAPGLHLSRRGPGRSLCLKALCSSASLCLCPCWGPRAWHRAGRGAAKIEWLDSQGDRQVGGWRSPREQGRQWFGPISSTNPGSETPHPHQGLQGGFSHVDLWKRTIPLNVAAGPAAGDLASIYPRRSGSTYSSLGRDSTPSTQRPPIQAPPRLGISSAGLAWALGL